MWIFERIGIDGKRYIVEFTPEQEKQMEDAQFVLDAYLDREFELSPEALIRSNTRENCVRVYM